MFRVPQMTSVITSEWFAILGTIGQQAHVVLAIFVCGYFLLIAMTAAVATFHHEADRRVDARKVLKRLLPHGRRHR
jgi:4-hydroxybenzoate polyprenyltransferase